MNASLLRNRLSAPYFFEHESHTNEVQFGNVENQVNHAFRHIDKAGLDRTAVQQAIRQDVSRAAESLSKGQQYTGNVVVNGTRIEYSAFKLENRTINGGRITPSRP